MLIGTTFRSATHIRSLAVAICLGVLFGVFGLGDPLEDGMHMLRNKLRQHEVSGRSILIGLDDRSVAEIGPIPWKPGDLTQLLAAVRKSNPRRVHFDRDLVSAAPAEPTSELGQEMNRLGSRLSLSTRFQIDPLTGKRTEPPIPLNLASQAKVVNTNTRISWDNLVREQLFSASSHGMIIPSLPTYLANVHDKRETEELFPIDYAINLRSIPILSASDVIRGRFKAADLVGKDVVIARIDAEARRYSAPGFSVVPAVIIQIIAAETLMAGLPIELGWLTALGICSAVAYGVLIIRNRLFAAALMVTSAVTLLSIPLLFESFQISLIVVPALTVLISAGVTRAWSEWRNALRQRANINAVSGMPNLQAMLATEKLAPGILVSLSIQNHAQIRASLADQREKELVDQVVGRLRFGSDGSAVHQGDDGVFVWMSQACEGDLQQQLDGLHALFRSPAVVGDRLLDINVTFGYDVGTERPLSQRLAGTIAAADEAAREGLRWKCFDPASLDDAEWTMSLLGRLDHALQSGQLWVAFQPKIDCVTRQSVGAEALVRWTHPEKGNIFPDQFIGAAERSGRIEDLTRFVLNEAVETAAEINKTGCKFSVAVNLSATLLEDEVIVSMIQKALLAYQLNPELLILEITETSTLGHGASAENVLRQLSELGVQLSIDDYGTGFSTLDYLKRVPASEIKIDRTFVSMLHRSQSDRIMVNSTIQLAHSLNRKVVAEGVENAEVLDQLILMGCDLVQGYHTARPMPKEALFEFLGVCGTDEPATALG